MGDIMSVSKAIVLAATALTSFVAVPALAQNAPRNAPQNAQGADEGNGNGNDIVVTARRVEEKLQDVPISITVFNQEQLTSRNITNSAETLRLTTSALPTVCRSMNCWNIFSGLRCTFYPAGSKLQV